MKTYVFKVVLEPDEEGWHIYYPPWATIGASTWGYTREEALHYIKEVLEMIIEEFQEEGTPLPAAVADDPADGIPVTVTVWVKSTLAACALWRPVA
jgi:predicted RNase H-like HicB family nuclease